ncbi:MAG: tRNA lysidine(34) synthetase TilS [Thermodesulfobacteriota bacterium]|nr:tRNA lysidine(34) synthetase TilS [Thermodesulfobacteriota bacterium]
MLISKAIDTIEKYRMLQQGERIVVAVSGGPDSVFLLYTLNELKDDMNLTLIVAHVDHCIRKDESKDECMFVKNLANRFDLPFESQSFNVPLIKKVMRVSTQEAARNVRYEFLMRTLRKYNAHKVATGHNADDQAETVLMRLIRGTGSKGLCGINPFRDGIFIRPIIEIRQSEIRRELEDRRIEFVIDSSNKEDIYLRNKIRNRLMPVLINEYNPNIIQSLVNTSEILRKEDGFLDILAKEYLSDIRIYSDKKSIALDILRLKDLDESIQIRVLKRAIELFSEDLRCVCFKHLDSIVHMLFRKGSNKFLNLPKGICIEKRYNELIIREEIRGNDFFYSFNHVPDRVRLKETGKDIEFSVIKKAKNLDVGRDPDVAFFDFERVRFPIILRNFKEGDRFQPIGLNGTKKLKDFFIDCKIPRSIRRQVPLLVFDDLIAWVIGLRIDHRVMLSESTKEILKVRMYE